MTDLLVGAPVTTERFEFYGCGIEVVSRDAGLVDEVRRDFIYFRRPGAECRFRIEMRLEASRDMRVVVRGLDLTVDFAAGEQLRTEISAKFRIAGLEVGVEAGVEHAQHVAVEFRGHPGRVVVGRYEHRRIGDESRAEQ